MEIIQRAEAKERGLKRYFDGKPCRAGHIAERLVSSCQCVECRMEQNRRPGKPAADRR